MFFTFFFFNDTATTEIYTLSLHDALPISYSMPSGSQRPRLQFLSRPRSEPLGPGGTATATASSVCAHADCSRRPYVRTDRKSTRLNSSHANISYAVFCLKKKKKKKSSLSSVTQTYTPFLIHHLYRLQHNFYINILQSCGTSINSRSLRSSPRPKT